MACEAWQLFFVVASLKQKKQTPGETLKNTSGLYIYIYLYNSVHKTNIHICVRTVLWCSITFTFHPRIIDMIWTSMNPSPPPRACCTHWAWWVWSSQLSHSHDDAVTYPSQEEVNMHGIQPMIGCMCAYLCICIQKCMCHDIIVTRYVYMYIKIIVLLEILELS